MTLFNFTLKVLNMKNMFGLSIFQNYSGLYLYFLLYIYFKDLKAELSKNKIMIHLVLQ